MGFRALRHTVFGFGMIRFRVIGHVVDLGALRFLCSSQVRGLAATLGARVVSRIVVGSRARLNKLDRV